MIPCEEELILIKVTEGLPGYILRLDKSLLAKEYVSTQIESRETPKNAAPASVDSTAWPLLEAGGLAPFALGTRVLLPIVQGGMGIGVSAHRLAGTVASMGAVGTISSIDLRRLHPDLMEQTRGLVPGDETRSTIEGANLVALEREIRAARELSQGRGLLALNVMRAVTQYEGYVRCGLESGIDAIVVGAGLPLDLPEMARDFPNTLLIPILSEARSIQLVVRRWEKRGRLPDAIVVEHPRHAGGHLGAAKIEDLRDPRFDFEQVIPQARAFFKSAGIEKEIPLIPAGGIRTRADIRRLQDLGAAAAQFGTAFAVTTEGDADIAFKRILAGAKPEDLVEFISVAGLPARAVRTPWFDKYLRAEPRLKEVARVKPRCTMMFDCLQQCGLRDGQSAWGQFCIDKALGSALKGDVQHGLFFRGAGALPFDSAIRPVRDLIDWLLADRMPADLAEVAG
jgi:nitronate monooxygenase